MVIFAHRWFFFSTLNISSNSLLACKVSADKFTNCFLGVLSYVPSHFSLVPFNILSLNFTFNKLIITWLRVVFSVLILYWALWTYFCYTIYFLDMLYHFVLQFLHYYILLWLMFFPVYHFDSLLISFLYICEVVFLVLILGVKVNILILWKNKFEVITFSFNNNKNSAYLHPASSFTLHLSQMTPLCIVCPLIAL